MATTDDPRARLATNLRAARAAKQWSQARAAEAAGLHLRHYQKLEAAEVNATIDTLAHLAAAFEVDLQTLLVRPKVRRG
jgi:transcriptional regulator with XRE-family HTH domain